MQVGIGYDIHRVKKGRGLWLGGIFIPCELELVGHSDGDVLIHALCDALLGAIGAGDMGSYFPDTDEKYRGRESRWFLNKVTERLMRHHYKVIQVDSVIVLERPRLLPYRDSMQETLSKMLRIRKGKVGIKAKTNEGLDSTGQKKAIAVWAVACVKSVRQRKA